MQSAQSIVVMYDVERQETLTHVDTFWLPLIEANTKVSEQPQDVVCTALLSL